MLCPVVRKAAALAALAFACTGSDVSAPRGLAFAVGAGRGFTARSGVSVLTPRPETSAPHAAPPAPPRPHGVEISALALPDSLSDADIRARLASAPESLGALSIGGPSRGALFNAARVPEGPLWRVVDPEHAWGAPEAIASLTAAIERVNAEHPDSPPLYVGQLSSPRGGYLRPHRSHQSGRDADIGYYYLGGPGWYARATAKNLDRERTWALVKALASDPNVEAIFMDRSVQRLLGDYARAQGEPRAWLDQLFEGSHRGGDRLVRHEWGHLTHLHVRFKCPNAQAAGARAQSVLIASRQIPDRRY